MTIEQVKSTIGQPEITLAPVRQRFEPVARFEFIHPKQASFMARVFAAGQKLRFHIPFVP